MFAGLFFVLLEEWDTGCGCYQWSRERRVDGCRVGTLRFLGLVDTRTIYVESFARVKRLSLTGRLLYWVVDGFLVQWPGLKKNWPRAEYRGVLVL